MPTKPPSVAEEGARWALRKSMDLNGDLRRKPDDDRRSSEESRSGEVRTALTERDINDLYDEVTDLQNRIGEMEKDRQRAIVWALITLGGAVVGMGLWIFKLLTMKVGL